MPLAAVSVCLLFWSPASSKIRFLNLCFMLFYEFNLRPQPQRIYVFLKRGGEIFKKPRTPRPAAPKSTTTAAETICRSLPYQYVCYFEVPASSETRLLNLRFMLFYEFNLRPQPLRIYVFFLRGEGRFSKNQEPQNQSPLMPLQLRRKPNATRCLISMSVFLKSPRHQNFGWLISFSCCFTSLT